MGAIGKYERQVLPHLDEIAEWYQELTEAQIAAKLGISLNSLTNYKRAHEEFRKCFEQGREILVSELKNNLKRKAQGFYYTEVTKTYLKDEDGNITGTIKIEERQKYAQPDTGAIHLLLKNLDENWRNDDAPTMELKRERLLLDKAKAEDEGW